MVMASLFVSFEFSAINHLARHDLVRVLPRVKFKKDHLCSTCAMGTSKKKKYILVIVDDYPRFTWVKFLASKDEAHDFNFKFQKMIQVRLNATVGISHETSVAQTPQQNGVAERLNRTHVEAARTMLIYAKAPLFIWAKTVATTCVTSVNFEIKSKRMVIDSLDYLWS
nr:hypothetical protein [Tanacetum cinerariifolium]